VIGTMLRKSLPVCVVAIVLSGGAGLAQSSTAAPPATGAGQASHSALPDAPFASSTSPTSSSSSSSVQGQEQGQPVSARLLNLDNSTRTAPVTVLEDTLIRVMTNAPLNSKLARQGAPVLCTVSEDVIVGDTLAIPRGTTVHGTVIRSRKAGVLTGSPELILELVSLDLDGRSYPLYTYQFTVKGTSKTRPTETKAKGGAVVGALVGGVFSGSAKGGQRRRGGLRGWPQAPGSVRAWGRWFRRRRLDRVCRFLLRRRWTSIWRLQLPFRR